MQRGSLTVWITEDVMQTWHISEAAPKRGHPRTYTDTAILTKEIGNLNKSVGKGGRRAKLACSVEATAGFHSYYDGQGVRHKNFNHCTKGT